MTTFAKSQTGTSPAFTKLMFESFEAAEEMGKCNGLASLTLVSFAHLLVLIICTFVLSPVDRVIYLEDFEEDEEERRPEAYDPMLWIQLVDNINSLNNKFQYKKCKVMLARGVANLSDIPLHTGMNVLDGQGFLVTVPSLPSYMKNNFTQLLQAEKTKCSKTLDSHKKHITAIQSDPSRATFMYLLWLPNSMRFCLDFDNIDAPPLSVEKQVRIQMREVKCITKVGKGCRSEGCYSNILSWSLGAPSSGCQCFKSPRT